MSRDFQDMAVSDVKAAQIIGAEPQTLRNWRTLRKGPPYIKLSNRKVVYLVSDLMSYLSAHRVEPMDGG